MGAGDTGELCMKTLVFLRILGALCGELSGEVSLP